jgi:hypothetical protein
MMLPTSTIANEARKIRSAHILGTHHDRGSVVAAFDGFRRLDLLDRFLVHAAGLNDGRAAVAVLPAPDARVGIRLRSPTLVETM